MFVPGVLPRICTSDGPTRQRNIHRARIATSARRLTGDLQRDIALHSLTQRVQIGIDHMARECHVVLGGRDDHRDVVLRGVVLIENDEGIVDEVRDLATTF